MTVLLTISNTSGGFSIADTTDLGDLTPGGDESDFQDLFISHDATVNAITDCNFYLTRYTGSSYPGDDADADLTEILSWGVGNLEGVRMSMVHPGGWVIGDEFASGWQSFYPGNGDINSQIVLDHQSLVFGLGSTDGEIPVNDEAHVQIKLKVPSSPSSAGNKGFALVLSFSATS